MQDIVPKGRSIRNVPLSPARSKAEIKKEEKLAAEREKALEKDISMKEEAETRLQEDIETEKEELEENSEQIEALRRAKSEFEATRSRRRRTSVRFGGKKTYISAAVVVILLGVFLVANALHSATITVTPRAFSATVNSDYIAKKTPSASDLGFTVLTNTQTGSETVRATGVKQVSTRATGVITIFNNYSSASQRLIKNTRFATPEGLIFRIDSSVTVPGKKGATPGSIDATVIADEAGTTYNVGLKDFTIPGFKGDPRYTGFYGRSKTAIAGGFVGTQPVISDADRAKAKGNIETKLKDALVKQVTAQVSADDVLFDKAYTIEYKALPDESASAGEATIKETGTINAAVFARRDLGSALARTYVKDYKGESVVATDADALAFQPKDFHPGAADTIAFHVTGAAHLTWLYDALALKKALSGQSRSAVPSVLAKFPQIEKADISIRPFWSSSFPSAVEKIAVK